MKNSIGFIFIVLALLTASLGCGVLSTPVPPTSTSTSTFTSRPPTDTPVPTATPTKPPTVTPTPTIAPPSIATEFLTEVRVLSYDSFDNLENWGLWDNETGSITDGVFELEGKSFWGGGLVFKSRLEDGEGILLSFKLMKANAQSEFVFSTGDWQTDSFRQFGIYNGKRPKADLFQGMNGLGGNNLHGNLTLATATWYNLLMVIGKNGEFLAIVWDPASEGHNAVYNETIGEKWTGKSWDFIVKADEGETVYVDNFSRISFGEIK